MDIHGKIEALRNRKGLTQQALADRMGVTHKAVFSWEHTSIPRKTKLHKLAEILEVNPSVLMNESEPLPEWNPPKKVEELFGKQYVDYLKELKAVTEALSTGDFTEDQRHLFLKFFSDLIALKTEVAELRSLIKR